MFASAVVRVVVVLIGEKRMTDPILSGMRNAAAGATVESRTPTVAMQATAEPMEIARNILDLSMAPPAESDGGLPRSSRVLHTCCKNVATA
jgi:hypothetical protein